MGAGRVVRMDITRIDHAITTGEFFQNAPLVDAMQGALRDGRGLHVLGFVSDGGVHSQQAHLYALLKMAKQQGLTRVYVHAFLDGRDTLPTGGVGYIERLQQVMKDAGIGQLASVSGRYYAMDRDRRWEREAQTFQAMVHGQCARWMASRSRGADQGVVQQRDH